MDLIITIIITRHYHSSLSLITITRHYHLSLSPPPQVIEDQSLFRLEELSYPETRLLTIFIGGDKEQKFDQDLVIGERSVTVAPCCC